MSACFLQLQRHIHLVILGLSTVTFYSFMAYLLTSTKTHGITYVMQGVKQTTALPNNFMNSTRRYLTTMDAMRLAQPQDLELDPYLVSTLYDTTKPTSQAQICVKTRTLPAFTICIRSVVEDAHVSYALLQRGVWEPHVVKAIETFLKQHPGNAFIDIGAYIGAHALYAAKLGRTVIAVDPYPENLALIHRSLELNQLNMTLVQACVSDARKEENFTSPMQNPGGSMAQKHWAPINKPRSFRCITLDDLWKIAAVSSAILKIDIEGSECLAITNSETFFQKVSIPTILMEWGVQRNIEYTCVLNMVRTLTTLGYQAYNYQYEPLGVKGFLKWPWDIIWQKKS